MRLRPRLCPIPVAVCQKDARGRPMRIPRPWERWRPGCCIHPGRLPCGPSALFNIGDLTLSLYESELATGLLPNKITDLSSLSNSGEAGSPKLNRASRHASSPRLNRARIHVGMPASRTLDDHACPPYTSSGMHLKFQAQIWPHMTARKALNPCDNCVTSDQSLPEIMFSHNIQTPEGTFP